MWTRLLPFLAWLPGLHRGMLGREAWVGLNGAILALPQSMAYALIAGLPAEYGLYAAMLPVAIACLWGSSRYLVSGPTAAISVLLFSSVAPLAPLGSPQYVQAVLLLTFLAGAFQWLLGVLRVGSLVNFVSHSVMLGFTLGAALLIVLGQLPYLLGLAASGEGAAPGNGWRLLARFAEFDGPSLLVGGFSFALSLLVRRLRPRWPALLLGLLGGATLVWALPGTFASVAHVQALSSALPGWSPLVFDSRSILDLLPAAVACGMLGLVTSLSIARALAARQGDAFDANQEVRAQGLSNLLGPWLSASLSAGSFTRSGLNLEAGARSPLAGAFSALWVALLAVLGARLIEHVPLPAMAAGILLIAWGLIDRPALRALYRSGRAECLVAGLTALATLLLPLQNAIYAGVLASLVFYLRRTSTPRVLRQHNDEEEVLRIEGSIFFGACDYLQRFMRQCDRPRLVLDARQVNFIDFAGAVLLQQEARRLHAEGRRLVLRHARPQVREALGRQADEGCRLHYEG
ncbi:SulP family inorganic anion transporter [Pseudomonas aeruginosa]|uniref:SulP family inorganic anion transporter n=1 Tax=Pseudomonas aeruginosa TaxID=287 RepID=UPI0001DCF6E8|nr:SulP family inorganic anion transporter [Pseudomonas aeruginosa]ALS13301.1 SulP family inorganic anion transporter [Pseudomonas aeruginosa]EKU4117978.1 SulP family inorganic anion transporter [Pseudomonas aeruginosa]ERY63149.1 sulfate transporter [Pseudomonas aeruginosa BL03]ESQ64133.1 SulP family inorganic anion transporter [Pseudomonas aeruginosa HB15]KAJ08686.1 SulP family inorganic anion transporter [Pseudomonas aeruginosa ID4365]